MFDFIKRRREKKKKEAEEKIKKIKEAREKRIEERKAIIGPYLEKKLAELDAEGEKLMNADIAKCDEANSKCPKCGSTSVINKFVKVQGSMSGNYDSFSYRGYGSGRGEIEGELDTFKVNECKDCGNQWEIAKPENKCSLDYVLDNFSPYECGYLGHFFRRIARILDGEEKGDVKPHKIYSCYKDTPREVIEYCLFLQGPHEWHKESGYILGTKMEKDESKEGYNYDKYLYTISDEVWEIAKKLIGR